MTTDAQLETNRLAQRELYGQTLHEIGGRLAERFGATQNRLAALIGISAPMLSQLMSARRVKIGNPVAAARLRELLNLADEADGGLDAGQVEERLAQIAQQADWRATTSTAAAPAVPADGSRPVVALFREVASAADFIAAAGLLRHEHPAIAELLEVYGAGRADDARTHYAHHVR